MADNMLRGQPGNAGQFRAHESTPSGVDLDDPDQTSVMNEGYAGRAKEQETPIERARRFAGAELVVVEGDMWFAEPAKGPGSEPVIFHPQPRPGDFEELERSTADGDAEALARLHSLSRQRQEFWDSLEMSEDHWSDLGFAAEQRSAARRQAAAAASKRTWRQRILRRR